MVWYLSVELECDVVDRSRRRDRERVGGWVDGWMEFQVELSFKVDHNIRSLNSHTHHSDRDRWFGISAFFCPFHILYFFPLAGSWSYVTSIIR